MGARQLYRSYLALGGIVRIFIDEITRRKDQKKSQPILAAKNSEGAPDDSPRHKLAIELTIKLAILAIKVTHRQVQSGINPVRKNSAQNCSEVPSELEPT